ncbi:invasion associated locus B family protein [Rhizobium leguminosarum]|uniref:invasion associated locus B family protein n=1 Tax=Rhizobium leguminosarum TaxID=384 RepID=UPI001AE80CBA|nr:invasion associated locus B family protein [Rhizobium leguminosarum]MBP2449070.1 invasion protein IalB [Rhizobium leguminosarum]
MKSTRARFLGTFSIAAPAIVAGVTLYIAPDVAISTPSQAASITDRHDDPAPQHFDVAQAQSGGQNTGAATASSLPGGASSLNETYKDWRVACSQQSAAKRCVLSQVQAQQDGQRVLAIELNPQSGNTVSGTLVLPFGLALEPGISFQIDEKPAMQPVRFRTCVPGGCLVAVAFDAPTLVALRAGTVLKLKAVADGGAAVPFSISLQGFATALDRVGTLSH